jgi:hypothetical protein
MAVSPDQRRALRLLAGSPDGCTMAIMLAGGFKSAMLNGLVREGLATTTPRNVRAGKQPIEVVRMMITGAGRLALDGR